MTYSAITHGKILTALVVACAMAATFAQPAGAQTAKKLDCKGCVKSKQLKNNGIKSTDIKNGQVKNADLGNNAVTGGKIADGAISGAKIANSAVNANRLASDAKAAGADFSSGDQMFVLTAADEVVRSVTITAPGPGMAMVNAIGTCTNDGASFGTCQCSITTGAALDTTHQFASETESVNNDFVPMAGTRGFNLLDAGSTTFNLVCNVVNLTGTLRLDDSSMTAIYVPQMY